VLDRIGGTVSLESYPLTGVVRSVQVGRIAPLGPDRVMSGFVKKPIVGPVEVGLLGLAGDEQADLEVHGGPDKAVYACSLGNYAAWKAAFPQHQMLLVPGGLGENLTIDGLAEGEVCLGDQMRIGTAVLQVSQPRQPCFKFALRFDDLTMPRAMVKNGMSGWYYRVLVPGSLAAGDEVRLLERPHPQWSIERTNRLIIQRHGTVAEKAEFSRLFSDSR
jgi:MOSC domain-containing protein YiiM